MSRAPPYVAAGSRFFRGRSAKPEPRVDSHSGARREKYTMSQLMKPVTITQRPRSSARSVIRTQRSAVI